MTGATETGARPHEVVRPERTAEHRYSLYRLRRPTDPPLDEGGDLVELADSATLGGCTDALHRMIREGDVEPYDRVGLLDHHGEPGSRWLLDPFAVRR